MRALLGIVFGIAAAALCAAAQAQPVSGRDYQELSPHRPVSESFARSFYTLGAMKKALDSYQVKGVPSFVIDGKYLTSARMAGGVREMMRVVEQRVERAAAERRK